MYEKGQFPELAVEDCNKILDVYDPTHAKARQRKLRILESPGMKDYYQALVEVCALQLLYLQQNRDQFRMGIQPSTPPPVPQSKIEELVQKLIPERLDEYAERNDEEQKKNPRLPSDYTLLQLLKSYTGYNAWMAKAAQDGSVTTLKGQLEKLDAKSTDPTVIADRASLYMKIGRRHVYDGDYGLARVAILEGYKLVDGQSNVQDVMKDDDYARLLEWTGMVKHWTYDLDSAEACYRECAELEPMNVSFEIVSCFCLFVFSMLVSSWYDIPWRYQQNQISHIFVSFLTVFVLLRLLNCFAGGNYGQTGWSRHGRYKAQGSIGIIRPSFDD
jgi:hypothetical protein